MKSKSINIHNSMKSHTGRLLFMLVLAAMLLVFGNIALAQNESAMSSSNSPQKPVQHLKQYFVDKYQKIEEVMSSLYQTPHGLQGSLHIRGHFMPKNAPAAGGDRDSRSRALAKAFLQEEASLLGITNMDEIREFAINTDKGYGGDITQIYYRRYINDLELDNEVIHITIGPDETINHVSASLVPVPLELYQAAAKETLPEKKIREIVQQDLKSTMIKAKDAKISEIRKIAVPTSPYVIWKVYAKWLYTIDAFTGEILTKKSRVIKD